jgi:hypothetical protein
MKVLLLSTFLIQACGNGYSYVDVGTMWNFGQSQWDKMTQQDVSQTILQQYQTLVSKETIQSCSEYGIDIEWQLTPWYEPKLDTYLNGKFDPETWQITLASQSWYFDEYINKLMSENLECIADTALAHELLHFVLYVARSSDNKVIDEQTDSGKSWQDVIKQTNELIRQQFCVH